MNQWFSHRFRGRFNAWMLHVSENNHHKLYGKRKQQIFEGLPDSVIEVGPGTGGNFRYLRQGTTVTAIEPNLMMHSRLRKNAEKHGIHLDIRGLNGEAFDIADESTDAVICTSVLCCVDNQYQVMNEVHRILRPGGRFLFLEHIAAPRGTLLRRFQGTIRRPWRWLLEGCDLTRETDSALEEVGFSKIELERFEARGLVKHYIIGVATK